MLVAYLASAFADEIPVIMSKKNVTKDVIDGFEKLNGEAVTFYKNGDYDAALRVLRRCLGECEKALGPDDSYVGKIVNNMAEVCRSKGDYAEALRLAKRGLSIREKFFGPDHVEVATSLNNLASIYFEQGDAARQRVDTKQPGLGIVTRRSAHGRGDERLQRFRRRGACRLDHTDVRTPGLNVIGSCSSEEKRYAGFR